MKIGPFFSYFLVLNRMLKALQSPKLVINLYMSSNAYGMKHIWFCLRSKKLVFSSKFSIIVVCRIVIDWPQDKNFLGNQPHPWVSQSTKVSSKSVILPFGALFVGCIHGLLIKIGTTFCKRNERLCLYRSQCNASCTCW